MVPWAGRLVLINGVPDSGKSTLARRWADNHPLTLALDLDVLRAMLGGRLEHAAQAGAAARFARRSENSTAVEHLDAAALLARAGGPGELAGMQVRLLEVLASRPGTQTLQIVDGEIDAAYRRLRTCLGEG